MKNVQYIPLFLALCTTTAPASIDLSADVDSFTNPSQNTCARVNSIYKQQTTGPQFVEEDKNQEEALVGDDKINVNKDLEKPVSEYFHKLLIGRKHSDTALKITSLWGAEVIKILCAQDDGTLRPPTDEEITLANKFDCAFELEVLKTLGKEHIDTAVKITSRYGGEAIKFLCAQDDGTLRTPTDDDIALANQVQYDFEFEALKSYGLEKFKETFGL